MNFDAPDAAERINEWVEEKTKGIISKIIGSLSYKHCGDLAILVNAIYFSGSWSTKFLEKNTKKIPFTTPDQNNIKVSMMNQTSGRKKYKYRRIRKEKFQAIRLPYGDSKRFGMTVFCPIGNRRSDRFLNSSMPKS